MIRTLLISILMFIASSLHSNGQSRLIIKKVVEERLVMGKFKKMEEEVYLKDGKKLYTLKYKDNEPVEIFTYYYDPEMWGIQEMFFFKSTNYPDFDGLEAIKKRGSYLLPEPNPCSCWYSSIPDNHIAVWVSEKVLKCYEYDPNWFTPFQIFTIEFY
jgi:hypothetical protein